MTVAPPKPHDALAFAAARLSRASPNTWDEFVTAFAAYTDLRVTACVNAQSDKVFEMQGRARECTELTTIFFTAIAKANAAAQAK